MDQEWWEERFKFIESLINENDVVLSHAEYLVAKRFRHFRNFFQVARMLREVKERAARIDSLQRENKRLLASRHN